MITLHGGTPDKPDRMPEDDPRGGHTRPAVTEQQQAPWLLPCGCVKATVTSPLDHRPRCATRNPDPSTFNITDAARWVVVICDDVEMTGGSHATAALLIWKALTGLREESVALDYARRLLDDPPTTAALAPF